MFTDLELVFLADFASFKIHEKRVGFWNRVGERGGILGYGSPREPEVDVKSRGFQNKMNEKGRKIMGATANWNKTSAVGKLPAISIAIIHFEIPRFWACAWRQNIELSGFEVTAILAGFELRSRGDPRPDESGCPEGFLCKKTRGKKIPGCPGMFLLFRYLVRG